MRRFLSGFTLLECLAVTFIIGILTGVAVPALTGFIDKQQADTAAWSIARQLNAARKFAITSGRKVTFCGVDADGNCTRNDIERFVIFIDQAYDQRVDEPDTVFAYGAIKYPGTVVLKASNNRHITFNADGSARQFGSVMLCPHRSVPQLNRRIAVHRMGRPYLETDKDSAGVVEDTGACGNHKNPVL